MTPCPTCGTTQRQDGRASHWRVRVRLYADSNTADPIADSDPELPADARGESSLHGLPNVAEHLTALAESFHGAVCKGLETATLQHKLKSLRVTLSRRQTGDAVWRVPYTAAGAAYRARVDIVREGRALGKDRASDTDGPGGRCLTLGGECGA